MSRVLIDTDNFSLPDRCSRCPFVLPSPYGAYCRLTEYNIDREFELCEKHECCPLKEVEDKEELL